MRCSGVRGGLSRVSDGFRCRRCDRTIQEVDLDEDLMVDYNGTLMGIGSKQTELSIFLEAHNVKVAAIQESKLTAKSRSPNIQNYTVVRQDRRLGPGGCLLFFIHNSVSFTRKPLSTMSKNDPPPRRTDQQHRYG